MNETIVGKLSLPHQPDTPLAAMPKQHSKALAYSGNKYQKKCQKPYKQKRLDAIFFIALNLNRCA
ncbi:hypothetical protein [Comamonas suwonensis]|uniref:Uncharacterized protein n=1 Tax=Comamonas suwonensis TaxID=2606214 RepID=A0A843B5G8_9BURK|nr:hypothetical protein [Comamonas suwonensis]MBI1626626.1 hypothetical protein [Comamonas suwonensis]